MQQKTKKKYINKKHKQYKRCSTDDDDDAVVQVNKKLKQETCKQQTDASNLQTKD